METVWRYTYVLKMRPQMRALVDGLGELEQPWNCPHGRPTMRHVTNLDIARDSVYGAFD